MADDFKESENETEEVVEDGGGNSVQQDSYFLLEMNLLTVLLSSLSVPAEEMKVAKDDNVNVNVNVKACCISRIQNRERESNEVKLVRRPSQRFQPIKDFRHCRRM